MVNLGEVLAGLPARVGNCPPDIVVTGLCIDSRLSGPGDLFFGIPGRHSHGQEFAAAAVSRGAVAAVLLEGTSFQGPRIEVADVNLALAAAAANFYGHPADRLQLVGVTGTNGKTTTTHFIHRILREAGFRAGMVGTVCHVAGGRAFPSDNTTPIASELHALFRTMVDAHDTHAVMEVSSHGLAFGRVSGLCFAAGVFTNLTHEHLDFHGDLQSYLEVKSRLFSQSAVSVLNVDDPAFDALKGAARGRVLTYSMASPADVCGRFAGHTLDGSDFELRLDGHKRNVHIRFPGRYNAANALAAAGAAFAIGIPIDVIATGLALTEPIPGRMEQVRVGQPFGAIVDYAHTPDGLAKALTTLRETTRGRVISVFGARGERDSLKRPIMGQVAGALADFVIVTTDSPYGEDPARISAAVVNGLEEAQARYMKIPDRADAIRQACSMAQPGDVVVVTGRGHEKHQNVGGREVAFDDCETMRLTIAGLMKRSKPNRSAGD